MLLNISSIKQKDDNEILYLIEIIFSLPEKFPAGCYFITSKSVCHFLPSGSNLIQSWSIDFDIISCYEFPESCWGALYAIE